MLVVIGCGNLNRSDDGVGVVVARRLQQRFAGRDAGSLRIFDAGTSGMEVMFAARGASRLIVVDASLSGTAPGALFEVPGSELEAPHQPRLNLHDFRWQHALHAGRMIFKEAFPKDVSVFLIEAQTIDYGLELSMPVAHAAELAVEKLAALAERHLRAAAASTITLRRGSLHIGRDLYERYFAGLESVILLSRGEDLLILPVRHAASGGYLLKVRNSRGDRVVVAADFLRDHGFDVDGEEAAFAVSWSTESAGLVGSPPRRS
jgi:hydrogenase maturation protease